MHYLRAEQNTFNVTTNPQNIHTSSGERNLFYQLPRELRDTVYEHALRDESLNFNHRGLNISASSGIEKKDISRLGLPQWLLTSRLICSEGIDTFLRTCYFSPRYRKPNHPYPPNTLLLHKNSIRNIKRQCPFPGYWSDADWNEPSIHYAPFLMFLQYMQPFLVEEPSLMIEWVDEAASWLMPRELAMYENWPKRMHGRFCTVEIDLLNRRESQQDHRVRKECAEKCAKKLVGDSGRDLGVLWGDEIVLETVEPRVCERCERVHHRDLLQTTMRRLVVWRKA